MSDCPKCGFAIEADAVECPACGIVLGKYRSAAEAPPRRPPVPAPPPPAGLPPPPVPAVAPRAGLPPVAPLAAASPPAGGPVITPPTLEALIKVRPWMRFLVVYGFVMLGLILLVALVTLVGGVARPEVLPLALVYLFYAAVIGALLMPFHRSVQALTRMPDVGPGAALEAYTLGQAAFWRRTGVVTVVVIALIVLSLLAGIVAGVLSTLE